MKKILAVFLPIIILLVICIPASANESDTYLSEEIQGYCVEAGEEYGICPELLIAMIETESSGNTDAENGDCKGLMQISDRWHKERMNKLGVADIYDSYGNILVGADYLHELFEKYEDVGMVLMVYNGDSKAKKYWNGTAELSEYAEKILDRSAELETIHETNSY